MRAFFFRAAATNTEARCGTGAVRGCLRVARQRRLQQCVKPAEIRTQARQQQRRNRPVAERRQTHDGAIVSAERPVGATDDVVQRLADARLQARVGAAETARVPTAADNGEEAGVDKKGRMFSSSKC